MSETRESLATVEVTIPPKPYAGYIYFLLRALVPGSKAPCSIWLEAYDRILERLSLICALEPGEEIAPRMLDDLQRQGLRAGYVRVADLPALQEYLAWGVRQAMLTPDIDQDKLAALVYEQALCAIKAAMLEPKNGRRLAQGASVARDMVQRIWLDEELRRKLILIMTGDDHLYAHAINTCLLGVSLARFLSWPTQDGEALALALFFHDLGMSEIPDNLLGKRGPLDKKEWLVMRDHPKTSYDLLKELPQISEDSLEAIRNHHENMDGTGYPRSLPARRLSRLARVARIVDVYEAMTSARSWRPAMRPFDALIKMRKDMTGILDPELLNGFTASLGIFKQQ